MTVQSLTYLAFLLVAWAVVRVQSTAPRRQLFLLAFSYMFYATWGIGFLAILLASSALNFWYGRILRRNPTVARLWGGIAFNLLILSVFKYLPLSVGITSSTASSWGVLHRLAMPVGISFWTFQALSYLMDVYREDESEPTLREFCLYMAFWPVVLSGPVCRLQKMLPQFREWTHPTWDDLGLGLKRILLGLFMKTVVSGLLAHGLQPGEGIDAGFDQIDRGWGGIDVWVLAIGFGFQLFFDFAGYSHIVIGSARLFGITLEENFDRPYLSSNPAIFWTRWHMSLSFWIRDYLFLPLATVWRNLWWRNFALILSMSLFGLWHGATTNFLLWGTFQGAILVLYRQIERLERLGWIRSSGAIAKGVSWCVTFAAICAGWIFFRAHTTVQALSMVRTLVSASSYTKLAMRANFYVVTTLVILAYFACARLGPLFTRLAANRWAKLAMHVLAPLYYAAMMMLTIIWSVQESVFVYFQF